MDRGGGAHGLTLFVNLLLAGGKLGIGWFAGSAVLVADGWHSLSDGGMNLIAWGGYRAAKSPPDADHHYGHGNSEALAGLVVGLIVLAAGAGVVTSVLARDGVELASGARGGLALAMGVASALVKLVLARHTARIGTELNSPSLLAISRDNFSDALTGTLVPIAVGCSILGVGWVEPATAVLIGLLIGWMGVKSIREGLDVLMDRVSDAGLRGRLEVAAAAVPGVRGVQSVRVHPLGARLRVDMEISVDGRLSVADGHRIAHAVEQTVVSGQDHVVEVHVHVNPS